MNFKNLLQNYYPLTFRHGQLHLKKLLSIFVFLIVYNLAWGQTDLKHFLPELKEDFEIASQPKEKALIATKISAFFITNKVVPSRLDSALRYSVLGETLSRKAQFKEGLEQALVQKVRILLLQEKYQAAEAILKASDGIFNCNLNFTFGRYYLEKAGEDKNDLFKAMNYFKSVENLSKTKMPNLFLMSRLWQYKVLLEKEGLGEESDIFLTKTLDYCRLMANQKMVGKILFEKGVFERFHKSSITELINAGDVATKASDTATIISCLIEEGKFTAGSGKLYDSEKQFLKALIISKKFGFKNHQIIYSELANVYSVIGNYRLAMEYGLLAVKDAELSESEHELPLIYFSLYRACSQIGLKQEGLQWAQKALESGIRLYNTFEYATYRPIALDMIEKGKAKEVLITLDYAMRKFSRSGYNDLIRGDCYAALNMPLIAEKYYLKIISSMSTSERNIQFYSIYKIIAGFYIKEKMFDKAELYVDSILAKQNDSKTEVIVAAEQFKFQIDSAKGKYLSAMRHLQRVKAITDSVMNETKIKQTHELQLQYATAKRDQENLELRNKNIVQTNNLTKEALQKKIISLGLFATVLVALLMVYLYIVKQKTNRTLRHNQEVINLKNDRLAQLLNDKEWLIKEIHHRVKNNLQIISSLLNTQSSFLNNSEAKAAIRDSQNRLQAISLLHQKLYQSEDVSSVSLKGYIEEISKSITDSFSINSNIGFVFTVEEAALETNVTVPLGLIINEAITNCVKYAFPNGKGIISIGFKKMDNGWYVLTISDNGKGLPENFDVDECLSLGINLIAGLSNQLLGNFEIRSITGTTITVSFPLAA